MNDTLPKGWAPRAPPAYRIARQENDDGGTEATER